MLKRTRNRRSPGTQSARLDALDASGLTLTFTSRRPGTLRSDCRLTDIASARLWLAESAPITDVLTMLEFRHRFELSSADCRAYATEILWTVRQLSLNDSEPISRPKESTHAAA